MIGKTNSIVSRFLERNENIFIAGSSCHLAHIAASNSHDAFCEYIAINVQDEMVDLFYWFDKSTKRKGKLKEYFEFCNQEYQGVLKHLSVRWLSLVIVEKYENYKQSTTNDFFSKKRTKHSVTVTAHRFFHFLASQKYAQNPG